MHSLPLTTRRLVLRHLELDDAPTIFALSQERGIRAWLPDQVYDNEETARSVLRFLVGCYEDPGSPSLGPYVLAVALRDSLAVIGHVGCSPIGDEVEVGYAIGAAYQGRGLATEAVDAASRWVLESFDLATVMAYVATDNHASCRVLDRAGFTLEEEAQRNLHGSTRMVRSYRRGRGA